MLIHQYDNLTGQYLSSRLADEDPRHAGRWIMPAFSTSDPLPERRTLTWPFYRDGAWTLLPDWRGRVLYRRDTGEPAEILIAGVSPEESGLTTTPRPSDKHVWGDSGWVVDSAAIEAEKRDAAMAEFERRMALARSHNVGKADALAAGLLTDEEVYYFKAWSSYQMQLIQVLENPTFPDDVVWPAEPEPFVPPDVQPRPAP
ncbi:tail fiber assembly protein [Ralstonia pickettii]|uniref:tail fiber assembly protein n=1 Tax=Ralstonia pickettii TaxID=329 RepID=UPI0027145451|nr:tail fiber assembly protein [Ralstonia pickettii]WKZ83948.1 tail fiber assembly protein [Ralstonia pickettii]